MKSFSKIFAIGAACSACLVVPAIVGVISGSGIAAATLSWANMDTIACVLLPLAVVAGLVLYQALTRKSANSTCKATGGCGCSNNELTIEK